MGEQQFIVLTLASNVTIDVENTYSEVMSGEVGPSWITR